MPRLVYNGPTRKRRLHSRIPTYTALLGQGSPKLLTMLPFCKLGKKLYKLKPKCSNSPQPVIKTDSKTFCYLTRTGFCFKWVVPDLLVSGH